MEKLSEALSQNFNILNFLDSLDDYAQIMDINLQVIWCNRTSIEWSKEIGYPYQENKNIFVWFPFLLPHKEKITKEYQEVIEKNSKIITEEKNILDNGEIIYTRTTKMPLDTNGKIEYIITIVSDQTSIKKEIEIKKQLELSNKMLKDFAHIISHDLREPLRTIVNFIGILKQVDCENVSEYQDLINKSHESGIRMQKMINDLLLISKLNENSILNKIEIDMNKLIEDVLADLDIKIYETHAKIHISENLHPLYGEFQLIRQIFLNLINNALTYRNGKQPLIEIKSITQGNNITYVIKDNGIGMSSEKIKQTFYDRSEWETPSSLKGGMGISICRRAVSLHHGMLYADSDGCSETTVYISIPNERD